MVKQCLNKILAILILVAILSGHGAMFATNVYAVFEELEEQKTVSSNKNVSFDTYFMLQDENKTHSVTLNTTDEAIVNFEVNVGEGYLKDTQIILNNANFEITAIENQNIEGIVNSFEANKIILDQISSNSKVIVSAKIKINHSKTVETDFLERQTGVTFTSKYTNIKGKTQEINSNIIVRVEWTNALEAVIDTNVQKYIQLNDKTIIQTRVISGINNNVLPIKNTNISGIAPQINGNYPQEVRVTAVNTIASNGVKHGNNFTKENYTYNEKTGVLEINVENTPDEQNKISWENGIDEYIITYIYEGIQNITNINLKITNNITTYKQTQIKGEITKTQEIILNGNNVDFNLEASPNLSKGYMYANSEYETTYQTTWSADITYVEEVETLTFEQNTDKFIQENEKKQDVNSYYKQTKINKANFNKILGEEGQAQIYNNDILIGTINKQSQIDEQGNYIFVFGGQISNIKIITSVPISEGKLIIENTKAITAKTPYNIENIKTFKQIENSLIGTSKNQNVQEIKVNTILEETSSKASVQISKQNLSTIVTNENVEIRAVLETDDITDDLYKNPTIEILLPEEIQSVNIKSGNLLFSDQMEITTLEIVDNHIIRIALTGEQTTYVTDGNKGITIILNTDLKLNRLSTSKQSQITMKVTNEKSIIMENEGIHTTDVNIVAPIGVIALNSVTNNQTGESVVSLESNRAQGNLKRNTQTQIATYTQTIINNKSVPISGAKIIGTIPTNGDNLGSNIDTKFASNITSIEGINAKIYYSQNINATSNLEDSQNGWNEEQMPDAKAYLIQINEDIAQGAQINFTYNVNVPENLEYGINAISSYKIEYEEKVSVDGQIASIDMSKALAYKIAQEETEKQQLVEEATPVMLTTGTGPVLEVKLEDNTVDGTVYTQHVATYKITVINKGTEIANNVKLAIDIPEGMVYARPNDDPYNVEGPYFLEEETKIVNLELGNIEINQTIDKEILLYAKEKDKNINLQAKVTANNIEETANSNILNINTKEKIITMNLNTNSKELILNEIHGFVLELSSKDLVKDLEVTINLPEGLEYEDVSVYDSITDEEIEYLAKYLEKDRNITLKLDELSNNSIIVNISVIPTKVVEGQKLYAKVSSKGKTQTSNVQTANIRQLKAEISSTSSIPTGSYVKIGEKINYEINIKNTSEVKIRNTNIEIKIPDEMIVNKVLLNDTELEEGKDYFYSAEESSISIIKTIDINENINIVIDSYIDNEIEIEEEKDINVIININDLGYSQKYNYTIEKEDDVGDITDLEKPETKKYKISGTAWLDSDKNGQMSNNETKMSQIPVKAINKKGEVISSTITNEDGTYTLEGLIEGEYTVIFEYDSSKYLLTTYQAEGVEQDLNSKVVKGEFEGKTIATTNNIKITNRSIANINIGLIEGSNFDLSLNKKVTQIAMVNAKTTKTIDYNTNLAKIDLDYKYIDSTKVAVEYEITVTNEGDIPGYATKIVDYLPTEFDFSTELNKDWYTSGKNIETKALENTIINPGETASITLILTKNMTQNDNGIVCNTAEIAENYNEFGEKDTDSEPANNKEGEDDISSANVILGLKTGGPTTYITLTITIMALICIGAYEINKRVLKI